MGHYFLDTQNLQKKIWKPLFSKLLFKVTMIGSNKSEESKKSEEILYLKRQLNNNYRLSKK